MTNDALEFLSSFFDQIWILFTSWHYPATNVSPAEMGFFLLFVPVALAVFTHITGAVFGAIQDVNRARKSEEVYQRREAQREAAREARRNRR